jgi:hypothetical protein
VEDTESTMAAGSRWSKVLLKSLAPAPCQMVH